MAGINQRKNVYGLYSEYIYSGSRTSGGYLAECDRCLLIDKSLKMRLLWLVKVRSLSSY